MELDELHIDQRSAAAQRKRVSIPGVLPRVTGDFESLADAARGQYHRRSIELDEAAGLAPVAERPGHRVGVGEQVRDRTLGENLEVGLIVTMLNEIILLQRHDLLLQGTDQLQARAVTDVRQPRVLMATEIALADLAVLGAVEQCTVSLQFPYPLRRFLRVQLGHPPVVEELAPPHGVPKMNLPT